MRVRSAAIGHPVVRVATARETWLLFQYGILTADLEADLNTLLRDARVGREPAGPR